MAAGAPARTYYAHVEGLRGVAALYVFLYHLWQTAVSQPGAILVGLRGVTGFLQYGHFAVVAFIVISGYCLGLPVAAHPERTFVPRAFAVRRARRLMPAYVGALALSIVLVYITAALRGHHIPAWHVALAVIAHLALVHNVIPVFSEYLNGPMWSIALECQIYVVFALLLVPVWRRFGPFAQLAIALGIGLAPHFLLHGFLDGTSPWLLGLFGMGVVAAQLTTRPAFTLPWRWISVAAAVLAVIAMALHGEGTPDGAFWGADLVVGAAVAAFFVASSGIRAPLAAQALSLRPIVILGAFSYSLYLVHGPAVELAGAALHHANASIATAALVYGLFIPVVLAFAYGFYRVLERPFLSPALRAAIDAETTDAQTPHPLTIVTVPDDEQAVVQHTIVEGTVVESAVAGAT
jgi:peptidoglycan/LPS O-acetylase OafA/YrhL